MSSARSGTPAVTLPGNPVSSFVSFHVFVLPALRRLAGLDPDADGVVRRRGRRRAGRRRPGKVELTRVVETDGRVRPSGGQGSHVLGALAGRDGARRSCPPTSTGSSPATGCAASPSSGRIATVATDPDPTASGAHPRARRRHGAHGRRLRQGRSRRAGRPRPVGCCSRPAAVAALRDGVVPKGDALGVARVAGIQAVKRTPELIPLAHPVAVHAVEVDLDVVDDGVEIRAVVRTADRTGIEMEALTAVAVAALALIDMVKAVDKHARITDVRVTAKSGGRAGDWEEAT